MTPAVPTTTGPPRSRRLQGVLAVTALALAAAGTAWAVKAPAHEANPAPHVQLSNVEGKDQPGL